MVPFRFALFPTVGLACALLCAPPATAVPVFLSYTASGTFPGSPPVSPLAISFQIGFDNSADVTYQTNSLFYIASITFDSMVGFDYVTGTDQMIIGANNGTVLVGNSNDFQIVLDSVSTTPTLLAMTLATDTGYLGMATSVSLTAFDAPEPASLGLLGAALAGIGTALRRRQTRS